MKRKTRLMSFSPTDVHLLQSDGQPPTCLLKERLMVAVAQIMDDHQKPGLLFLLCNSNSLLAIDVL